VSARLSLIATCLVALGAARALAGDLASAPVDVTMFRDGEVNRSTRQFGSWSLVCDEIPRLRQRYCSLSTQPRDAAGQPVATLIVSTGDDGRPAALLRAPVGLSIGSGLLLLIEPPARAGAKAPERASRRLDFIRCDAGACLALWSLSAAEIDGLNAGGTLRLRYQRAQRLPLFALRVGAPENYVLTEAAMSGGGFAEAVQASIK